MIGIFICFFTKLISYIRYTYIFLSNQIIIININLYFNKFYFQFFIKILFNKKWNKLTYKINIYL
jgi:hypothetical protein